MWTTAFVFLAARRKICLSLFPSLSLILADQGGQVLTTVCLPPAPLSLTAECPVLLALAAVGLSEKNCSQNSGLQCSPIWIIISFKPSSNLLIQMRFVPEEQILDIVYLILSQNSTERSPSNLISAVPALCGELDSMTSAEFSQA